MAVRTGIDIGRLKGALRSPGIDTRMHVVLGEVEDVAWDAEFGMYADVKVQPDLHTETCLVGSDYAGDDSGEWNPLKAGDMVLVAIPDGKPGFGPVLFTRVWSASAKPPKEFSAGNADPMDPATDRTIVVDKRGKYRIVARDGAQVNIEMSGGGDFNLTANKGSNVNITGDGTCKVNFPTIILGEGGAGVARIGDMVAFTLPQMTANGFPVVAVPPTGPNVTGIGQLVSASAITESS